MFLKILLLWIIAVLFLLADYSNNNSNVLGVMVESLMIAPSLSSPTITAATLLFASSSSSSVSEKQTTIPTSLDTATTTATTTTRGITKLTLPPFCNENTTSYPSPLHHIYVQRLLSPQEADNCCQLARAFATHTGRWDAPDDDRHLSYATCDFPVEDCAALEQYLADIGFHDRLWTQLGNLYSLEKDDMDYLDLFVANYQAKDDNNANDGNVMDRLELHRDGTLLSFSLLLNSQDDFSGGGTFYDALRDSQQPSGGILHPGGVIRPQQGEAVLHCGKILHGAHVVTTGQRTVLVGFVDVADRCTRAGVLKQACTDFGRMDGAARRYKRQKLKNNQCGGGGGGGWWIGATNKKFIQGHSQLKAGFIPAFESVAQRGEADFQRQRKLQAEDRLLRSILLPKKERKTTTAKLPPNLELDGITGAFDFGEITVL